MKRTLVCIFAALVGSALCAFAQKSYEPMNSWPYQYRDFTVGVIRMTNGDVVDDYVGLNICLVDGSLHYVTKENIMQADMTKVFTARIGNDTFVNIGKKMHKILWEGEKGAVVELTSIDLDQMNKASIGYGISSATASTQKTSLDLMGGGMGAWGNIGLSGKTYSTAYELRDNGEVIPTRTDRYLLVQGIRLDPDRHSVLNTPGVDADEAKAFFKTHKIKWNKVESLAQVVEFIYDQKNK